MEREISQENPKKARRVSHTQCPSDIREGSLLGSTGRKPEVLDDDSSATMSVDNSSDIEIVAERPAKKPLPNPRQKPSLSKISKERKKEKVGAMEVFCGCARMAKELQEEGFDATAIDYKFNKDKPETKAYLELDLTTAWGVAELHRLIKKKKVKVIFGAPPCGSASAARNIRRKFGPDPKPLRSAQYPDGLPDLSEADKKRIDVANNLYKVAAELALYCTDNDICWVIENPTNSLMWKTTPFLTLFEELKKRGVEPKWCHMQMCMHGGSRDKRTSLLYDGRIVSLDTLAVECDKSHTHKAWGMTKTPGTLWATAEERNYPRTFCKRFAKCISSTLIEDKEQKCVMKEPPTTNDEKTWTGKQPRRNHKDLVSEFKEILTFTGATLTEMAAVKVDPPGPRQCGNRLLGNVGKIFDSEPEEGGDGSSHKGSVGVFWTQEEFTNLASSCTHPMDEEIKVPARVAEVFYDMARLGPEALHAKRTATVNYYTERAKALDEEERILHSQLNPEVQEVIKGKRILLFKEMLRDIAYDDMSVVQLLSLGVRVVGICENTGIWVLTEEKLPRMSIRHLWASAQEAQKDVLKPRAQQDDKLAKTVWDITAGPGGEVESGLLKGPFTPEQISEQVGKLWVPARRFGLQQGAKIRPVDDFSQYGTNRAFGSEQKVAILGVDHVLAWTRALLHSAKDGVMSIKDSTDTRWETPMHQSWTHNKWSTRRGRVADLKTPINKLQSLLSTSRSTSLPCTTQEQSRPSFSGP